MANTILDQRRLEAITCANSGIQLALADDVGKRLGQRGAIIAAPRVILCKFSSFQSKIARI